MCCSPSVADFLMRYFGGGALSQAAAVESTHNSGVLRMWRNFGGRPHGDKPRAAPSKAVMRYARGTHTGFSCLRYFSLTY